MALSELLGVPVPEVAGFCDAYFDQFFLLHKIGHIIADTFTDDGTALPAQTEYLANLFALKYLQCKSEVGYLHFLTKMMGKILDRHQAYFDFNLTEMNSLYPQYKRNLKTYSAFHFNAFRKGLNDTRSLDECVGLLSHNQISLLNPFILLRKGARGQQLVNECLQKVFEFSGVERDARVLYASKIQVEDFEVEQPGTIKLTPS